MRSRPLVAGLAAGLLGGLAVIGCGLTDVFDPPGRVAGLIFVFSDTVLAVGDTIPLVVVMRSAAGDFANPRLRVTSLNPTLLQVNARGDTLIGLGAGRAVHVISETARTRFAAQLLEQGRLKQFGALLYESHESCRRLYECSSPELDTIVATAKRAGALGARLTGAGWGGAAIVLVNKTDTKTIPAIQRAYERAYGRSAAISEVHASAGAHTERI